MSHSPNLQSPTEALESLCGQFRDVKHDVNNTFAVLLALAELGERNASNYERLGKAVLERCPKVVHDLQIFQNALFSQLEQLKSAGGGHAAPPLPTEAHPAS